MERLWRIPLSIDVGSIMRWDRKRVLIQLIPKEPPHHGCHPCKRREGEKTSIINRVWAVQSKKMYIRHNIMNLSDIWSFRNVTWMTDKMIKTDISVISNHENLRNLSYCEPKRNGMRVFKLCWYLCFLGGGPGSL